MFETIYLICLPEYHLKGVRASNPNPNPNPKDETLGFVLKQNGAAHKFTNDQGYFRQIFANSWV